eukprot:368839-Karenia_brevis.AAC.1
MLGQTGPGVRTATMRQPRKKTFDLLPEYRSTVQIPADQVIRDGKLCWEMLQKAGFPTNCKLLDEKVLGEESGSSSDLVTIGVPWNQKEFVQAALMCVHPFDLEIQLPPQVVKSWVSLLNTGVVDTIRRREAVLRHYEVRACALERAE